MPVGTVTAMVWAVWSIVPTAAGLRPWKLKAVITADVWSVRRVAPAGRAAAVAAPTSSAASRQAPSASRTNAPGR